MVRKTQLLFPILSIGVERFETPPLTLTRLGAANLAFFGAGAQVLDFVDIGPPTDFGADDSVSVQLHEFRMRTP